MPTSAGISEIIGSSCRRQSLIAPSPGAKVARRRNKSEERDVAQARIGSLLTLGRTELLAGRADLAERYGRIGLRVAEKYQTGLTRAQKSAVCRKCGALRSSATSRTRLRAGRVAVTCLRCGHVARRPLAAARPTAAPQASQPAIARGTRKPSRSPEA
jgi:RNase P subunit RPR2